jgi:hypothetical protein
VTSVNGEWREEMFLEARQKQQVQGQRVRRRKHEEMLPKSGAQEIGKCLW